MAKLRITQVRGTIRTRTKPGSVTIGIASCRVKEYI